MGRITVEQTLVQLRAVLSTTSSVLLAIDGKLMEAESGNGSLLRRVNRIEGRIEGINEGVERVERVVLRMDRVQRRLFDVVAQRPGDWSRSGNGTNQEKHTNTKRTREPSLEIPESYDIDRILEEEEEAEEVHVDGPGLEEKVVQTPAPPKRRRLMSDNEIWEMEMEQRVRAAEAAEYQYSEEPDDSVDVDAEEDKCLVGAEEVGLGGKIVEIAEARKPVVVGVPVKRRILLTTQELEGVIA